MATLAQPQPVAPATGDERFFLRAAIVMAIVVLGGFGNDFLTGRSTLAAPIRVHIHAFFFLGWVAIYLMQNIFVATDRIELHRRLGWVAAFWIVPMMFMGCFVTVAMVRAAHVPWVFKPLQFLVFDPVIVFTFAALTIAAVRLRRQTEWHRRLHYCAMSMLIGPGIARLLPLPLFVPWAWESFFASCLIFPLVGVYADVRRCGRAHPAWKYGIAAMIAGFALTEAITYSPVGVELYATVVRGSPGASVAPLEIGMPPTDGPMMGRH
jgi:hypothetical protein